MSFQVEVHGVKGVNVDFEVAKNPTSFQPCYGSIFFCLKS